MDLCTPHLPAPSSSSPRYPGLRRSALPPHFPRRGSQPFVPGVPSFFPRTTLASATPRLSAPGPSAPTSTPTPAQPLCAPVLGGCPATDLAWGHLAQVASRFWAWPGVCLGPSCSPSRCGSESPRRRSRPRALGLGEVLGGSGVWSGHGGAGLRCLGGAPCRAGLRLTYPRLACARGLSGAGSRWYPTFKWDTHLWHWTHVSLA